jgi:hypothetical protein
MAIYSLIILFFGRKLDKLKQQKNIPIQKPVCVGRNEMPNVIDDI